MGSPTLAAALRTAGLAALGAALLFNRWVLAALVSQELWRETTPADVRTSQLWLGAIGLGLLGAAWVVGRRPPLPDRGPARPAVKILLVALATALLLASAELALRPFTTLAGRGKTTLFVPDRELGWRLRPSTVDSWGGVRVEVNAKGLRGPELDYAKDASVYRILYLGDSVTFGYGVAPFEATFPARVEPLLEARVGGAVETVNAAVGGYSPWQEQRYLEREGLRYDPDLVLVCFVLNDVTSKFRLRRFGGTSEGAQLESSVRSPWLEGLYRVSSVAHHLRRLGARLRYGPDIAGGAAEEETLSVQRLMTEPDSASVQSAWKLTRENLGALFDTCAANDVPAVLVVLPYAFQLDLRRGRKKATGPQRILADFAAARGLPLIDLLAPLDARKQRDGGETAAWFIDHNHLTAAGHAVVAEVVAEALSAGIVPTRDG